MNYISICLCSKPINLLQFLSTICTVLWIELYFLKIDFLQNNLPDLTTDLNKMTLSLDRFTKYPIKFHFWKFGSFLLGYLRRLIFNFVMPFSIIMLAPMSFLLQYFSLYHRNPFILVSLYC